MQNTFPTTRLAAVQASSIYFDLDASVEKACRLIEEAGNNGAEFIGFPEGFLPGFPLWYRFFVATSQKARELAFDLFENAVEVPSPATDALCDAARRAGAYVAIGINERVTGTLGTLYNSLLFISAEGAILGCHRKLVPTDTERLVHTHGDGSTLNTYQTPIGSFGGLICGEHTTSFARLALLLQQERIHIASWPPFTVGLTGNADGIDIRVRYHAFEGKLFVISAAGVLDNAAIDRLGLDETQRGAIGIRGGHSGIIDPHGKYIAGPAGDEETILYADADVADIVRGKLTQDTAGHYNRFDIFSLTVRPMPNKPITVIDDDIV